MVELRPADLRTLAHWCSPDYVVEAARSHGNLMEVAGARGAMHEVLGLARSYMKWVRHRDGIKTLDLRPALQLRALGLGGPTTEMEFVDDERNPTLGAFEAWRARGWSGTIPGWIEVRTSLPQVEFEAAVVRALYNLPDELRLVWLRGALWRHLTPPPVWATVQLRDREIAAVPLRQPETGKALRVQILKGLRRIAEARQQPTYEVGVQVAAAWARCEPIWSPGVFLVSLVGDRGVEGGWAALPPLGYAATVVVGAIVSGSCRICLQIDHRAWNGSEAGRVYQFIRERVGGCS
jgi:hypothetical protein